MNIARWLALATLLAGPLAWSEALPLRMEVQGEGSPAVVFEAGLGDTFEVWHSVQAEIARRCTRTVSYSRAGYPGSPRSRGPRDAKTIVEELRASLRQRGIEPPYVLVGHSLGGLYMQYFARNYPGEVTGLLLVDATHWEHLERLKRESPGSYRTVRVASLLMSPIMRRELADSVVAGEQVRSSPHAGALPTIVLSSTRASAGELPSFRQLASRMQDEIAAEFPAAKHVRVEGSAHYIQRDRPEVVVEAVRELARCSR